jgi:hypothetical protein
MVEAVPVNEEDPAATAYVDIGAREIAMAAKGPFQTGDAPDETESSYQPPPQSHLYLAAAEGISDRAPRRTGHFGHENRAVQVSRQIVVLELRLSSIQVVGLENPPLNTGEELDSPGQVVGD